MLATYWERLSNGVAYSAQEGYLLCVLRGSQVWQSHQLMMGLHIYLVRENNGTFAAAGGDPCVLQHVPELAKKANFDAVSVSSHAHVVQSRDGRASIETFFPNKDMMAGGRRYRVVSQAEIEEIHKAVEIVEEAETGFFISPNIELLCRVGRRADS